MEKIQVHQTAGKVLGLKPDKDGFYFVNPNKKLTIAQHNYITSIVAAEVGTYYVEKLNALTNG